MQLPARFAAWLVAVTLFSCVACYPTAAQFELLTPPGAAAGAAWKSAQLESIDRQLLAAKDTLRSELLAQKKWLSAWRPGSLTNSPVWAAPKNVTSQKAWQEPVIDPSGLAAPLRARLLGPEAKPTERDTDALTSALQKKPNDLGLRQLNLHWIDQYQFRKQYSESIRISADGLAKLISQSEIPVDKEGNDLRLARAFALYRKVRAIAYRGLPEVTKEKPIENPDEYDAQLRAAFAELVIVAGTGRSEFILIEIRMARRDMQLGTALAKLEDYGETISRKWLLKKRRDILRELGWTSPADEAAKLFAAIENQPAE